MITPEENIKTILADWLDALRRCDALIYILRFLRFLRNDLSVKTSDESRWLDQPKDAHAQSKSSSKLPSSAPLNGT